MTYSELRTLFATAARRLRRPKLVPAVHTFSHGPRSSKRMSAHPKKQNPSRDATGVFFFRSLAMTYSHMGKPHTTIGDEPFHY